jgi:hypothetical protein
LLCLYYVTGLIQVAGSLLNADGHIRPLIWNGILPALFLISYVVNIGFSRPWKKWPAIVSAGILLLVAGIGTILQGDVETLFLARAIWLWEFYLFLHLGLAFIISGVIGTPGCEMRAFHDLYSRIKGTAAKEHYCPVGPLHPIDQWEARRA